MSTFTGLATRRGYGIEVVYQDLALADNLDVVANMFLGRERIRTSVVLDESSMERSARETLEQPLGHDAPLRAPEGRRAVRRPAPVGRRRQGGYVGVEACHPRRADRGPRGRPDAPGARTWCAASPSATWASSSSRTTSTTSSSAPTGSRSCASASASRSSRRRRRTSRRSCTRSPLGSSSHVPGMEAAEVVEP